jgi:Ca2+-binding RTX toxin-like protein
LVVGGFNGNAAQGTGGNGTLTVDGATSSVDIVSDMNAEFNTGDGEGTLGTSTFQNGAAFSITGTDFAALNVGRDGGDGLVDIQTGASATLGGADTQIWIGTAYGNDAEAGLGEIRVQSGGGIVFAGTSNSLNVGGSADARGLLNVLSGGAIDLGGGDGYVWSSGAGSSAHAIVDGAGSRIDNIGFFGVGRYDTGIAAGAAGKLTVSNSGVVGNAGAVLQFGSGGTLAGRNGTLVGDVEFKSGGKVDLRDNALGTMTLDGNGTITGAGNSLFLDVSAAGNDRLIVDGGFHNTGSLAVTLNALSGYKFVKGQSKTIATFDGGDTGNGTYTVGVTGQQSDFSYYVGKLGANLKNVVLVALNNGNTASAANAGILDFVSGAAAKFVYNSATQTGTVLGGKFGADGGYAVKVDDIRGTNGVDNFSVTGTTARVLKFDGKGGNDIIKGGAGVDTILGGVGNDTILGNNGNDILQGDTGKDTMTGGLGNDTFKFTLKTHSAASHTLADVIMDFDDKGNDKIDLAGIYGPKLSYIGAAAFTKVGQVRVNDIAGPDVIVEVNLSGSLASDFAIRLKGTTLAQVGLDDFVL